MKLLTSIPPRRDGTVIVTAKDGTRSVFKPGDDGELVGVVDHPETVAELLAGGMFFPADPADYDKALEISGVLKKPADDDGDGADPAAGGEAPAGSKNFPEMMEIAGKHVPLADVVAAAFAASGMSVADWNALTETERDDLIDAEIDRMDGGGDEKPAGGLPVEANTAPKDQPKPAGGKKK